MLHDARLLEAGAEVETDVCVVGSGPAGLAVALELAGLPVRVCVLESGGLEHEDASQDLGAGDPALRFGTLDSIGTTRQVGGNANAWVVRTDRGDRGIRLAPLSAADFEARAQVPHSGWPVGRTALEPYVRRAQAVFGLDPDAGYEARPWATDAAPPLEVDPARAVTRMFQFADGSVFTGRHRDTLAAAENVTLLHHATALAVESGDGGRVAAVRAESVPGRRLRVRATQVVLAGGGLASTQLLLASLEAGALRMGAEPADNVGRYFNDHLLLHGGHLTPVSARALDALALYDLRTVRGTPVMGHLELADEALRAEPLLQLSAVLFPQAGAPAGARQQAGLDAALRARDAVRAHHAPTLADLRIAALGLDGAARRGVAGRIAPTSHWSRGGWSARPPRARVLYRRIEVAHSAEQAPHRDNRVLLGEARDAFGQRRVSVDWRWHDEDVAATMRGQELYARELARTGIGTFHVARADDGGPVVQRPSTGHFMGTTRMSAAPRDGVVDAACRVHGVDNLYVASSAVFPTGGFVNPTLTIVALALRVADELKRTRGLDAAPRDLAALPEAPPAATPGAERGLAGAVGLLVSLVIAVLVAAVVAAAAMLLHH